MAHRIGVDIGGTKIAVGLVDDTTGKASAQARVPTLAHEGGLAVLARAIRLAHDVRERSSETVVAVGIGAGGQIDPRAGVVVSATEILPGWTGTPLKAAFETALQLPASVDNDVNALAVGELIFGAGVGARNLLFLALGTGVGGAVVSEGCVHHGAHGAGGELGHLILHPDGKHGIFLEDYTNGSALVRYWRETGSEAERLDEIGVTETAEVNGVLVGQTALRVPEGFAARAVVCLGEHLGLGLASLVNLFDPERVLIGGGLAELGDLLLNPARRVLRERALPSLRETPIVPAALGPDAAIVGAACLTLPLSMENHLV